MESRGMSVAFSVICEMNSAAVHGVAKMASSRCSIVSVASKCVPARPGHVA